MTTQKTTTKPPKPKQIASVRKALGYTQSVAAEVLCTSLRTFIAWERGETAMHPIIFRWFSEHAQRLGCSTT